MKKEKELYEIPLNAINSNMVSEESPLNPVLSLSSARVLAVWAFRNRGSSVGLP